MNEQSKYPWGCTQWVIVLAVLLLGWMLLASFLSMLSKPGMQTQGVVHCKQIILSLMQYSKDHDTAYPDHEKRVFHSANEVFRELFKKDIIADERIFGCPKSPFNPDNVIGDPPGFEKALQPGECHWMLLKGQWDDSHPDTPLVIENSLNSSWPPRWDVSGQSDGGRGRSWSGGKIIIGRNDGSVSIEKLRPDGTIDWHAYGTPGPDGKRWIDTLTPEQVAKLSYWDIEEK